MNRLTGICIDEQTDNKCMDEQTDRNMQRGHRDRQTDRNMQRGTKRQTNRDMHWDTDIQEYAQTLQSTVFYRQYFAQSGNNK